MEAQEKVRRLKRQAKWLASMIEFYDEQRKIERASGRAVCPICGLEYYDHPELPQVAAVVTCEGKLFHL